MDVFYVIPNQMKEICREQALRIRSFLEDRGKVCYLPSDVRPDGNSHAEAPYTHSYTCSGQVPEDVEAVLVLGGDGTLLQASRDLVERGLPLLGINMGTLGYLAEIEAGSMFPALERLMAGDFAIEERMMLTGSVYRQGKRLLEDIALNDIVIVRRGKLRVVDFKVYVNDTFLCSYRADGIILATATGSTGYSLSVGGPIVSPDAMLMLMTAVSPHTLNARPIVLPDHVQVTVEIGGNSISDDDGAEVTFDGDTSLSLRAGDTIRVSRSQRVTRLIKINNTSFVENLRKKLN